MNLSFAVYSLLDQNLIESLSCDGQVSDRIQRRLKYARREKEEGTWRPRICQGYDCVKLMGKTVPFKILRCNAGDLRRLPVANNIVSIS